MPDPVITTDTPPANTPASVPAEAVEALNAKVAALEAQVAQGGQLLQQYQVELARRPVPSAIPATQPEAQFDEATTRFVNSVADRRAEEAINRTLGKLTLQSQIQQSIGNNPELTAAATKEYQSLKTNPYYQNQSDEILMALAAGNARATYAEGKSRTYEAKQAQEDASRQASSNSIPSNSHARFVQPTAENPNADLDHYMKQPESQQIFRKLFNGVDPFSDTEVRFIEATNAPRYKAKDAFKLLAERAVRRGSQVGPNLQALLNSQGGE